MFRLSVRAGREWPTCGGTHDEQRVWSLQGITPANTGSLGIAWTHEFPTSHGVETTPIVVDRKALTKVDLGRDTT